ncbi:MAG: thiamine pyrophosphate-dependent dehydrogenase E1 component subunit alpha [Actinomycetota bacterium]|nr:MAG: thiamine pyrophosphate-dependent dehydrogenase E1 component subunit alpha [Actinomycetota bacterium]
MSKNTVISSLGEKKLINMYETMVKIRTLEDKIRFLFLEGKMPGTIHQYIGMEACATGVCAAIEKHDIIASTHRPHGHAIARGLSVKEIMAELYGKTTGCCKGKGGSMHIGNVEKGMLPAIAVVGANIPIVTGVALAFKLKEEPGVAVSFFGDGAANEGAFHEGLNMAAVFNLPAIFVCENNQYGASTNVKKAFRIKNIADRASSYGIKGDIADGMDVLDVYSKAKIAVDSARSGNGPTLLELKTFRFCGHSRRDPANYIPREEKDYWKAKDPILNFEKILLKENVINNNKIEEIKNKLENLIDKAADYGQNSPDPGPEDIFTGLYADMEVPD